MIILQRIKKFEQMGLGLFVHFGLYSVHKKGEWANVNYQNKLKVVRVIDINKSYLDLRDLA